MRALPYGRLGRTDGAGEPLRLFVAALRAGANRACGFAAVRIRRDPGAEAMLVREGFSRVSRHAFAHRGSFATRSDAPSALDGSMIVGDLQLEASILVGRWRFKTTSCQGSRQARPRVQPGKLPAASSGRQYAIEVTELLRSRAGRRFPFADERRAVCFGPSRLDLPAPGRLGRP